MSYTQGTWRLYDPAKDVRSWGETDKRLMVLHPDGERVIANLHTGFVGSKGTISTEERLANARLIASAPRMLEVLGEVLTHIEEEHPIGIMVKQTINLALTGEDNDTESCHCGTCGQLMVRMGVSRWQCNYCDTVDFLEGRIKEAITLGIMISYTKDEAEKQELIRKLEDLRLKDDEPTEII